MSTKYPDLLLTQFPDALDSFPDSLDITSAMLGPAKQYRTYMMEGKVDEARQLLNTYPDLKRMMIDAEKINRLTQALMALERYFKEDVIPDIEHIAGLEDYCKKTEYTSTAEFKRRYVNSSGQLEYAANAGNSNNADNLGGHGVNYFATKSAVDTAQTTANTAQTTANAAMPKSGGTFTGNVTFNNKSRVRLNGQVIASEDADAYEQDGIWRYVANNETSEGEPIDINKLRYPKYFINII